MNSMEKMVYNSLQATYNPETNGIVGSYFDFVCNGSLLIPLPGNSLSISIFLLFPTDFMPVEYFQFSFST
jgi:hypothetical protein